MRDGIFRFEFEKFTFRINNCSCTCRKLFKSLLENERLKFPLIFRIEVIFVGTLLGPGFGRISIQIVISRGGNNRQM